MRARHGWLVHLLPVAIVLAPVAILLACTVSPGMAQETGQETEQETEQKSEQKKDDAGKTEEPIPLEELRVKGSAYQETPPDFPGTVNVVPKEEIERLHPSHVGEVLQRVPGAVYVDEDGRGLKPDIGFRGLNPTRSRQVLILVDGIPVQPSLYGDPAAYYNVPVQRLERVEVIKGGGALLYGANTVGGVVNYITRRVPEKPLEFALRESFGSFDTFTSDASVGGTVGNQGYLATFLRKQGDGFRDNLDFTVNDGSLRLEGDLGDRSGFAFTFNYHDEDEGTAGGLTPLQFRQNVRQNSTPNDRFEAVRLSGDLTYTRALGSHGSLKATVFGNFFERNWFIAGLSTTQNDQFRRKFDVFGVEPQYVLRYALPVLEHNTLTAGFRIYLDRETDRQVRGASPTARTGTTIENNELGTVAYAVYVQNEFGVTERLKVTPGLRLEFIRLRRDDFVRATSSKSVSNELIPALGASYRVAENTFVFANVQRSFKPPEFREAIDPRTGTDRDLGAQRGTNYEVGARAKPVEWFSAETSLFLLDFDNQIISEAGRLVNAQDARHQGIEGAVSLGLTGLLEGPLRLALPEWIGDLSLYYSLALLDTEFRRGPFTGNRLPFAPTHQHYWSVRHVHPIGLSTSLDGRQVGEQFPDGANTRAENAAGTLGVIPRYTVWDLNLDYRWKPWGSAFFGVKNLFDERYFTFRGNLAGAPGIFPSPGRTFEGGITLRF
jgi:Fe(3+) dicitrate transport protein